MKYKHLFKDTTLKKKQKYTFSFIDGNFGDGKTLFLTNYAWQNQKEYSMIFANYHLKGFRNFKYLDEINKNVILDLEPYSLLLLQEAYHYFDKRYNMTKKQKEIMKAVFQIRKHHIDVVCDITELTYLDFRVTDKATDYFRALGEYEDGIFLYRVMKPTYSSLFAGDSMFFIDMKKIYKKYNHEEVTYDE